MYLAIVYIISKYIKYEHLMPIKLRFKFPDNPSEQGIPIYGYTAVKRGVSRRSCYKDIRSII